MTLRRGRGLFTPVEIQVIIRQTAQILALFCLFSVLIFLRIEISLVSKTKKE